MTTNPMEPIDETRTDFAYAPQTPSPAGGHQPLNPAQQEVLDLLRRPAEPVTFNPELRGELRFDLEAGLLPLVEALPPDEKLFISKYPLAQVHGCEAKFVAERDEPFAWTAPTVRGSIAHKAIELSTFWKGEFTPIDLVDEAMARLAQGTGSLADFLQTRSSVDEAELRAEANDRVTKFIECFPPLKKEWKPVTESSARVELFDERIVLQGRVDLTLGHARGSEARKLLVDLKTGGFSPSHVDDLRFYALLETIRLGTPPRLLATYYLDSGRPHPEKVSEDLLRSALHRTIDGATRMVELLYRGVSTTKRAGPACRWCILRTDCDEGAAFLDQAADFDGYGRDDDE